MQGVNPKQSNLFKAAALEKNEEYKEFSRKNKIAFYPERTKLFEDDNSYNLLTKSVSDDKIMSPDIVIGKSLGAKAKNYEVMDLATGEFFNFVEGSKMQDVEVFAGKNTRKTFRNAEKYALRYGGATKDWQHVKCIGLLDTPEGELRTKIHWVQCENIGKFEFFVKEWID